MKDYPFSKLSKRDHSYKRFKLWVQKSILKDSGSESFLVPYEKSKSVETFMTKFNRESNIKLHGRKILTGLEVHLEKKNV